MLGAPIRLRDEATLDDLGLVHAPPSVEIRDLLALEDRPPLLADRARQLVAQAVAAHRVRRAEAFWCPLGAQTTS